MSDKPEVNSKKQIHLGIVLDDRDDIIEHIKAKHFWIDPLYKHGHANVVYDFRSDSCIHVIEYKAFEAQALEHEKKLEARDQRYLNNIGEIKEIFITEKKKLESKIESLEQMRSLDQNAIEAKDHKIVLLEQANAKLEGEINRLNQKYDFQLLVKSNEELKQENTELKAELMAVIKDNINLEHGLKFEASIRESIQERLKNQIDNFRELEAKAKLLEAALEKCKSFLRTRCLESYDDMTVDGIMFSYEKELAAILTTKPSEG
jgi:chromosome segregation ATPase